jgi:hypothetical protein
MHPTVEAIGILERQTLLSCFNSSDDRMIGLNVLVMALVVVRDHDFFRICILVPKNSGYLLFRKKITFEFDVGIMTNG